MQQDERTQGLTAPSNADIVPGSWKEIFLCLCRPRDGHSGMRLHQLRQLTGLKYDCGKYYGEVEDASHSQAAKISWEHHQKSPGRLETCHLKYRWDVRDAYKTFPVNKQTEIVNWLLKQSSGLVEDGDDVYTSDVHTTDGTTGNDKDVFIIKGHGRECIRVQLQFGIEHNVFRQQNSPSLNARAPATSKNRLELCRYLNVRAFNCSSSQLACNLRDMFFDDIGKRIVRKIQVEPEGLLTGIDYSMGEFTSLLDEMTHIIEEDNLSEASTVTRCMLCSKIMLGSTRDTRSIRCTSDRLSNTYHSR